MQENNSVLAFGETLFVIGFQTEAPGAKSRLLIQRHGSAGKLASLWIIKAMKQ